ncbi:MAG: FlgN protein [Eubacterium sp.]|nr:FlgN protein [Eubacterium sp.]
MVAKLTEVLNKENEIYDTLYKLSNNKTDLIVGGKVQELENIVKIEQSLVIKIAKLEDQREKIVGELCTILGQKPEDITISELTARLGDEKSTLLKECQDKMLKNIDKLKNTNDLNSRLIKNSLEYIDFSINMMTSIDTVNNSYGSSGFVGDTKKRNLFDVKL